MLSSSQGTFLDVQDVLEHWDIGGGFVFCGFSGLDIPSRCQPT